MTGEALPSGMQEAIAALLRDRGVPELLAALAGGGEETRIVGGAVRNALMGTAVSEIDFATTALPEEVTRRAAAGSFKSVPTGIEHGTVTVIVLGRPFEVTTLREDIETDGRRAVVRFGRSFAADAARRDFTMNALSVSGDGSLHDEVGGLADIAARRVRFIGEAERRIKEDYLRILRFFRFHAAYAEGELDAQGFSAAIALREGLLSLSAERVRNELLKLLVTRRAVATAAEMLDGGFWPLLLGGVPHVRRFANFVRRAGEAALEENGPLARLAALAVATSEDAARLRERLRLSNADAARLAKIARAVEQLHAWPEHAGRAARGGKFARLVLDIGASPVGVALAIEGGESDLASLSEALTRAKAIPAFPLTGGHIVARGVKPGPNVGRILALAREAWIEADYPLDGPGLATILDKVAPR
jgi:tRNA nucleotidyltransferase/poly(A) polymerase